MVGMYTTHLARAAPGDPGEGYAVRPFMQDPAHKPEPNNKGDQDGSHPKIYKRYRILHG